MSSKTITAFFCICIFFLLSSSMGQAADFSDYVDEQGDISLPRNFRTSWAHLGSWIVPNESSRQYGFHNVYTQQGTVEVYQETEQFPDGALLIRVMRDVESSGMPSGQTSWAGDIRAWTVMVKDAEGRFSDDPNWGHGWGWAEFRPENPGKNVSSNYETDCLGCHIPARETDFVNVRGYPLLR